MKSTIAVSTSAKRNKDISNGSFINHVFTKNENMKWNVKYISLNVSSEVCGTQHHFNYSWCPSLESLHVQENHTFAPNFDPFLFFFVENE